MLITRVELENIKSHKNSVIDLQKGVNAIIGGQGSGKTTIIEAIGLALFQSLAYKHNEFIRRGCKSGKIRITLDDETGNTIDIIRVLGSGTEYYIEKKGQRIVELKEEIVPWITRYMKLEGSKDLTMMFDQLIGPAQGTHTAPFLLSPSNKKRIFDPILGIDQYEESWKRLRSVSKISEDKISSLQEKHERLQGIVSELVGVDKDVDNVQVNITAIDNKFGLEDNKKALIYDEVRKFDLMQSSLKDLELKRNDLKFKKERILEIKERIAKCELAGEELEKLRPELEEYNKLIARKHKINEIIATIRATEMHLKSLKDRISGNEQAIEEANNSLKEEQEVLHKVSEFEEADERVKSLKASTESLLVMIKHYKNYQSYTESNKCPILKEDCPKNLKNVITTILSDLDEKYIKMSSELKEIDRIRNSLSNERHKVGYFDVLRKSIKKLEGEIKDLIPQIEKLDNVSDEKDNLLKEGKEIDEIISEKVFIQEQYSNYEYEYRQKDSFKSKLADIRSERDELKIKIESIKTNVADYNPDKHSSLKTQLDKQIELVSTLKENLRNEKEKLELLKPKLDRYEKSSIELNDISDKLKKEDEISGTIDLVRNYMREIPPLLIERYLIHVNYDANAILHDMTDLYDEMQWTNEYELTMDGKVFRQLSGGEEMTAAICIRLALLKNLSKIDFAIFDEPTDGLDEIHRGRLGEMIARVTGFKQLIVISHDSAFDAVIENTIHVHKDNGVSIIT